MDLGDGAGAAAVQAGQHIVASERGYGLHGSLAEVVNGREQTVCDVALLHGRRLDVLRDSMGSLRGKGKSGCRIGPRGSAGLQARERKACGRG